MKDADPDPGLNETQLLEQTRKGFNPVKSILRIMAATGASFLAAATIATAASADVSDNTNTSTQTGNNTVVSTQAAAAISDGSAPDGGQGNGQPGEKIVLEKQQEIELAREVLRLGEVLALVARDLRLHVLCSYLFNLATTFNAFYENCPVLQSEGATRTSRLKLCKATARALSQGLDLLGIPRPERM